MLLDCPACARSYHVSRAEIGDGRAVVCPRCEATWFVDADGTSVELPAEELRVAAYSSRPVETEADWRDARVRRSLFSLARPVLAGAACLALAMGVLGERVRIVKLAPRVAGLYAALGLPVNVRGLEIATLTPVRPAEAPADMTVSGTIRNVAARRVAVPLLTYEVRDAAGAPLLTWSEPAPARSLATGKTLPFVSSPHRLPPDASTIIVRFEDAEPALPVRVARRTVASRD